MPLPSLRAAAVYIRVSTEDQAELSPDSQLDEIIKYAGRECIAVLSDHIYVDAGISGKKAERRPAFMRMIAAAKEKDCPFSIILLWKYSRFARNQEESIFYKSILRSKCGVEVLSVTEPLAAGPFGSLIERIIEWMDEFYSIRLSQEVKRSMTVNARRGRLQCAPAFGYRAENGRLTPEESEADLVRYIFERFLSGQGLLSIARELNALGIRTHRGNPFESRAVEYILRNPVYIGRLRWNPAGRTCRDFSNEQLIVAESDHQPLVSPDIWEAAQCRLDERKMPRKPSPDERRKRWLSGIVRCAACGGALIFAKPHYYKCGSYTRGRCTRSQHIRCELLEEAVLARLSADIGAAEPLEYEPIEAGKGSAPAGALENALRQIRCKKTRLRDAYLAGALELGEFAIEKEKLERDEAGVRRRLEHAGEGAADRDLPADIARALETLRISDDAKMASAVRAVIDVCTFDKDTATLAITYRAEI